MLPSVAPATRNWIACAESAWPSRFWRISSSAVMRSSLIWPDVAHTGCPRGPARPGYVCGRGRARHQRAATPRPAARHPVVHRLRNRDATDRSEERRVGKECRFGWLTTDDTLIDVKGMVGTVADQNMGNELLLY